MSWYRFIKPKSRYQCTSISIYKIALFILTKQNFKINCSVPQEESGCQIVAPAGIQQNISSEKLG